MTVRHDLAEGRAAERPHRGVIIIIRGKRCGTDVQLGERIGLDGVTSRHDVCFWYDVWYRWESQIWEGWGEDHGIFEASGGGTDVQMGEHMGC